MMAAWWTTRAFCPTRSLAQLMRASIDAAPTSIGRFGHPPWARQVRANPQLLGSLRGPEVPAAPGDRATPVRDEDGTDAGGGTRNSTAGAAGSTAAAAGAILDSVLSA